MSLLFSHRGYRATERQLAVKVWEVMILMMLALSVLVAVDRSYSQHSGNGATGMAVGAPQLEIDITHYCCTGCDDSVFKALKPFPWMGPPRRIPKDWNAVLRTGTGARSISSKAVYSGGLMVSIPPAQLSDINLMNVYNGIRGAGLVPDRMILTGVRQVQVTAVLPHLCCLLCVGALQDAFPQPKHAGGATGSVGYGAFHIEKTDHTVTLSFHESVDIAAIINALEQTGFVPSDLRAAAVNK